jgi:zinc transport system substrate-binding protein
MRLPALVTLAALAALTGSATLAATGCSKKSDAPERQAPAPTPTAGAPAATPGAGESSPATPPPAEGPLRIGVTLHPYYSWAANVVAGVPGVEVVSILPGDVDAGSYQPSPADIAKLTALDAIVVNNIGHDAFIKDMIKASGNTRLLSIDANTGTPLLDSAHGGEPNSHTFISISNAIAQSAVLATKLGGLRPSAADRFRDNAAAYGARLRKLEQDAASRLAAAKIKRVVTVHDGYSYLMQELGIEVAGVVEPGHGLVPSAKELGEMISLMKKQGVTVVLTEEDFPEKLLTTLREATGAKVYVLSHVATGPYTAEKFETEMAKNLETLVQALVTDPK